jgi:NADPH-dependent glutamate synthase beta subunit-like oxidoreductase
MTTETDANLRLIGRDTDVDMTEEQRTSYLGVQSHTNAEEQRPTDLEERPADPKEQRLTTLEERQTDSKEQNPTDVFIVRNLIMSFLCTVHPILLYKTINAVTMTTVVIPIMHSYATPAIMLLFFNFPQRVPLIP